MIQETLEEAAEKYSLELLEAKTIHPHEKTWIKAIFVWVAKWQAERMYNKEEVDKLLDKLLENHMCSHAGDELIEQFKNK